MVSEGARILYSVLSKRFASRFGESAARESGGWRVPVESVTQRLNAGGGMVEERGTVPAKRWFSEASGELREEVIGLGRYGKTLTVLTVNL